MIVTLVVFMGLGLLPFQFKTPPNGGGASRNLEKVLPLSESKRYGANGISGSISSISELAANVSPLVTEVVKVRIWNGSSTTRTFAYRDALRLELRSVKSGVIQGSFARDSAMKVSSQTSAIGPGESFAFDRNGVIGVASTGRVYLALRDETGGITTYSDLIPGRYFFIATYDADALGGKRSLLRMKGTTFLLR
jgi:hypothetical protein